MKYRAACGANQVQPGSFLSERISGVFPVIFGKIIIFLTIGCSRGAAGVIAAKTAGIRSTELKGGGRDRDEEGGVHNGRHGHRRHHHRHHHCHRHVSWGT